MAKTRIDEELFQRLRTSGLRKRTARLIAQGSNGRRTASGTVRNVLDDLKHLVDEVEDRASGGPAKRRAAAKKAAATRRRNAQARRTRAKKAAETRAKARS